MIATRHVTRRALSVAFAAAVLVTAAVTASASASGRGATIVRGTQLAAGTCDNGGYEMTGSFTGCWWIDTFETKSSPDKSHYRATGTEHFDGCLGAVCGTLTTTYSFTAKTDGPWPASAELHGRYVNFLGRDDGDARSRALAVYGPDKLARLTEIKRRYDPDNVFRINHNIPPV
jgi:hypothetical protein